MAFTSGTATDQNDLLSKIKDFCTGTAGWTLDSHTADNTTGDSSYPGSETGYRLHIHKGDQYFNLRSCYGHVPGVMTGYNTSQARLWGIAVNGSDSYSGSVAWNNQTGAPPQAPLYASAHPQYAVIQGINKWSVSYWLFSTTDTISIVVGRSLSSVTNYQVMHFGKCVPMGAWATTGMTGSLFCASGSHVDCATDSWVNSPPTTPTEADFTGRATANYGPFCNYLGGYPNGAIKLPSYTTKGSLVDIGGWVPMPAISQDYRGINVNVVPQVPYYTNTSVAHMGFNCELLIRTPCTNMGNVTPLFPIYLFLTNEGGYYEKDYVPVGTVDGVRMVTISNLTTPPGSITIGSDEWLVFPTRYIGQASTAGLAFKK